MIKNIKNKPKVGRPREITSGKVIPLYLNDRDNIRFSEICEDEGTTVSAEVRKFQRERIEKKELGMTNPLNMCENKDLNNITLPLKHYIEHDEAEKCIADYVKSDEKLDLIRQVCRRISEHANSKLTKRYTMLRWE